MSDKLSARILKEIRVGILSKEFEFIFDDSGVYGEVNTAYLRFTIENGIYEGQTHILRIKFMYGTNQPYIFPNDPPNITFETPIFHTNIAEGGSICLDVIQKDKWSPMYSIETIFYSILALLDNPNTSSPFNSEASREYTKCFNAQCIEKYKELCIEYYRKKMPKNIDHKIWKLLQADEFKINAKIKLEKHNIPKNLWPKDLLEPVVSLTNAINDLEMEPKNQN
jgi:ubiquitin-protein ligase